MIIDFHVHGKITSSFPFDEEKFLLTVNKARENGLNALVLTEHLHAKNFLEAYEFLKSKYNRIEDYYDLEGFKVFCGMEVTTKQDLDILIIGKVELVLKLGEKILDNLNGDEYIDINNLFKLDISDELLIILAHPFREHMELPSLEKCVLERLDAVELNSKDIFKFGLDEMKHKVTKLAEDLKCPITVGSDTHYFIQMSTAKNILSKNCNTVKEIKEEIKLENYNIDFSSDLDIRVEKAIAIKKQICKK